MTAGGQKESLKGMRIRAAIRAQLKFKKERKQKSLSTYQIQVLILYMRGAAETNTIRCKPGKAGILMV